MTAEVVPDQAVQPLYFSPLGLFGFQVDGVARAVWQLSQTDEPVKLVLYDQGIGKTHVGMVTAAMLFEDDLVDLVVVVAEATKVRDWVEDDFPTFTRLDARHYGGSIDKRTRMLRLLPTIKYPVLVMSYETGRNDICTFATRSRAVVGDKMLTQALVGKRVLIVFDEFSRLRNRTAKASLAWDYLVNRRMRKDEFAPNPMLLGLTATTVERSPEDHYNACRILSPQRAGNVSWFYQTYVSAYDRYERPSVWKNLVPEQCEPDVIPLNQLFGPITLRKSKFDDDVIDQFPAKIENPPTPVRLDPAHQDFYERVEVIFAEADEQTQEAGGVIARQVVGHPVALLASEGIYSQQIVAAVGADYLTSLVVAKVEAMLNWQARMTTQQTVIFTFFGRSILPLLHQVLTGAGYLVSTNHGGLSEAERKHQRDIYRAGDTQVFLSSDAGARGLNLGCGSGLLHYEAPWLHSTFVQRSDRIHRIDSRHASITIDTLLTLDTIEQAVYRTMLKRNRWAEQVQEDDMAEDVDPGERSMRAADRYTALRRITS